MTKADGLRLMAAKMAENAARQASEVQGISVERFPESPSTTAAPASTAAPSSVPSTTTPPTTVPPVTVPPGSPGAPTGVTAVRVDDPDRSLLRISWTAPPGPAPLSILIDLYRDGAATPTTSGVVGILTSNTVMTVPGSTYRVGIRATNAVGTGPSSVLTAPVKAFIRPSSPGMVSGLANGVSGQVGLMLTPPASNGDPIDLYRVTVTPAAGATTTVMLPYTMGLGPLVTGLTNGVGYGFAVQACNQGNNLAYCSAASMPTPTVIPYGPPTSPMVRATATGTAIRITWAPPLPNGRAIDRMEMSINGAAWETVVLEGTRDITAGCAQTYSISVRAVSVGIVGPVAVANAVGSCPRSVAPLQGPPNTTPSGGCPPGRCSMIAAALRGFEPGNHSVACSFVDEGIVYSPRSVTIGSTGDADVVTSCWVGASRFFIHVDGVRYGPFQVDWRR